jgi:hypothetical protein
MLEKYTGSLADYIEAKLWLKDTKKKIPLSIHHSAPHHTVFQYLKRRVKI